MHAKLVSDTFSHSAWQYDQHASVQREAARRLANFITSNDEAHWLEPIVEIGCGTGMLSELLLEMYPEREMILTDLSQEMLDMCAFKLRERVAVVESNDIGSESETDAARMAAVQRTGMRAVPVEPAGMRAVPVVEPEGPGRIRFRKYDANSLAPLGSCGTIFSSFALQWVADLEQTLAHLVASTSGAVYFSVPCHDSFPEWRQYADLAGVQCTINNLPRFDDLLSFCERTNFHIQYEHYSHAMQYGNALSFFRALKASGASSNLSGKTLSTSQFQRLIKTWDTQSSPILSTYSIINAKVWR